MTRGTRENTAVHAELLHARGVAVVPRAATLDGFVGEISQSPGVRLNDLQPLTTLIVITRNSRYRMILTPDGILIQGGQFFPETTAAKFDGSSLGGSFLKIGVIAVGLHMEIRAAGQRIVTSPVRAISEERPASM
jgi:hypothetical protein